MKLEPSQITIKSFYSRLIPAPVILVIQIWSINFTRLEAKHKKLTLDHEIKYESNVVTGWIKSYKEITWDDKSAAVKMIPAVMLLVRIGLASIIPRYQLTNPLLALTLAAAAAALATEEPVAETDEEDEGLVPLERKEMRWDLM